MKYLLSAFLLSVLIFSCNSKTEITKISAIGKPNHVLVVIDNDQWQGEIGDMVRNVLAKSLVGFPQDETRFTLSQIAAKNFNSMLKSSKNIMYINVNNKHNFKVLKDKYAAPQRIIVLNAKDKNDLEVMLKQHEKDIVKTFNDSDIANSQRFQLKSAWSPKTIKSFKENGFHFQIPTSYLKVQDTLNYIWFRKEIPRGSMNLQAYVIPIQSEDEFNGDNIIKFRNEMGEKFIPGEKEDMYMSTENAYTPIQYNINMLGRKTIETRGIWEMKNNAMAGPFLNYAILDKKNNRIIIIEGFVYAPNASKRNYLFDLEALLKTLKIND